MRRLLSLAVLVVAMPICFMGLREAGQTLGLIAYPIPVVGTGSMYPSLYWSRGEGGPDNEAQAVVDERRTTPHMYRAFRGLTFLGTTWLKRQISYGDLVAFQSSTTESILKSEGKDPSAGFIKRVIGLPGDTIQLKDGYVLRNGKVIDEPYIYKPRSTYDEQESAKCQVLTIPADSYFVLGDNRKVSADSRGELGVIRSSDISFILPQSEQTYYHSLWRDPSHDAELAGTPSVNVAEFVKLVNEVRVQHNLTPLKLSPVLTRSATYSGNGASLESALTRAGYRNHHTGELALSGHFSASELVDNLLYFAASNKLILDPVMSDLGLVDLNRQVDGCPDETIVIHLGGYIPATYSDETKQSWQNLEQGLVSSLASWETAVQYISLDQSKLARLLALLNKRLALAKEITSVMEKSEWLTKDQEESIKQDELDATTAAKLALELNQE